MLIIAILFVILRKLKPETHTCPLTFYQKKVVFDSETEEKMQVTFGDTHLPNPAWGRPQRITAIAHLLKTHNIETLTVYFGGERFCFKHKDKYVVIDIWQRPTASSVMLHYSPSELVLRNPSTGSREKEFLAGSFSEAGILDTFKSLLAKIC